MKLPPHETAFFTFSGMMLSVVLMSFAGKYLRRIFFGMFFRNRKIFSPRNRRVVRIWRKYGIWGVGFLTPLLFSPIGGTMIAVSFGEKKRKIFLSMSVCGAFWSLFFAYLWETLRGFV
jgi:hypothetical protein